MKKYDRLGTYSQNQVEGKNIVTNERILIDHRIMGGVPCIRGTRIPVATILGLMAEGAPTEEILGYYPQLLVADLLACLEFAATAVDERHLPLKLPAEVPH